MKIYIYIYNIFNVENHAECSPPPYFVIVKENNLGTFYFLLFLLLQLLSKYRVVEIIGIGLTLGSLSTLY